MSSSSASFHRKVLCSSLGVVLGAWAFYMTQKLIVEPEFVSIGKTCSNHGADSDVDDDQLHAYEPLLGFKVLEPFVCLMTQFMHKLVESHPAGLLTWGTTMIIALPAICLMLVEAGRSGSYGIVKFPMLIGILYQVLGISVIFPLLWVPAYCFGRNDSGVVSSLRAKASFPLSLSMLILTILLFTVDTNSYAWTLTAGTLGGPAVVMIAPTVLYWLDPPSQTSTTPSPLAQKQSSQLIAMAYGASGVVSLLGWYFLLYVAWTRYETNVAAFLSDVWGATSNPFIRFMTIDALVLWLAVLIHIGFRNVGSAVEAVLLTPLFGPGAACAMALSGVETMEEQKLKRD